MSRATAHSRADELTPRNIDNVRQDTRPAARTDRAWLSFFGSLENG